jgi:hypothetical protein
VQKPGGASAFDRKIGVCDLVQNPNTPQSAVNTFEPVQDVHAYFRKVENVELGVNGTVTSLKGPKHGKLDGPVNGGYLYTANDGYHGADGATFEVKIGGHDVEVVYYFNVMAQVPGGTDGYVPYDDKSLCPHGEAWRLTYSSSTNYDRRLYR